MTQLHQHGVRFVGVEKLHLDSFTAQELQRVCFRCVDRLRERVGDLMETVVHVRAKKFPGELERYTVNVDLTYAGGGTSAASEDWYLTNAIRDAFAMLEAQLESASIEF